MGKVHSGTSHLAALHPILRAQTGTKLAPTPPLLPQKRPGHKVPAEVPAPAAANCGFHLALESSLTQNQNPLLPCSVPYPSPFLPFASSASPTPQPAIRRADSAPRRASSLTATSSNSLFARSWSLNRPPVLTSRRKLNPSSHWPPPRRATGHANQTHHHRRHGLQGVSRLGSNQLSRLEVSRRRPHYYYASLDRSLCILRTCVGLPQPFPPLPVASSKCLCIVPDLTLASSHRYLLESSTSRLTTTVARAGCAGPAWFYFMHCDPLTALSS